MYHPGTFLMYIDMDAEYPAFAPKARFITPLLHPNVTKQGRICHSILDRNSSPCMYVARSLIARKLDHRYDYSNCSELHLAIAVDT